MSEMIEKRTSPETTSPTQSIVSAFKLGDIVVYGIIGKAQITGVEEKNFGTRTIPCYRLELIKGNTLTGIRPPNKNSAAIWIPIESSQKLGLRNPMTRPEAEEALKTLTGNSITIAPTDNYSTLLPQIELALNREGAMGLVKAIHIWFQLKQKGNLPSSETNRYTACFRLLVREVADATEASMTVIEEQLIRMLKKAK